MQIRPNNTLFEGDVLEVTPCSDRAGANVRVRVSANLSEGSDDDFLQPARGAELDAYCAVPGMVRVGGRIRAAAHVLGDGAVRRAVISEASPLD